MRTRPSSRGYPRVDIGSAVDRLNAIETGWWWNPNEPGRGFFVEVQGASMFFSGFMYTDDGRSAWYIATGAYSRGVFEGSIVEFGDGQEFGGAWREPRMIADRGRVTLATMGDGRVLATMPGGNQSMLTRFAF